MKVCKNCNLNYRDNVNFCPECGSKLEIKPIEKICRSCGRHLEDFMAFCPECGKQIEKKQAESSSLEKDVNEEKRENKVLPIRDREGHFNDNISDLKSKIEGFSFVRDLLDFRGRRNRLPYFMYGMLWTGLNKFVGKNSDDILIVLFSIVMFYLSLVNVAKRLHDLNFSAKILFLPVLAFALGFMIKSEIIVVTIMIVWVVISLLLALKKGTDGANKFGDDPLGISK